MRFFVAIYTRSHQCATGVTWYFRKAIGVEWSFTSSSPAQAPWIIVLVLIILAHKPDVVILKQAAYSSVATDKLIQFCESDYQMVSVRQEISPSTYLF